MAKVPFSKLQASVSDGATVNFYYNLAGDEINYDVKQYLPIQEKLELVSRVINQSVDDNGFYNPMRVKIFMVLEIVYAYTNLSFTAKQKENPLKLYDILVSTGIFTDVVNVIREKDWLEIQAGVWDTIKNIYDYRNSVMGILDTLKEDYSSLDFDLNTLQQSLSDPDNMTLLKDILNKLG